MGFLALDGSTNCHPVLLNNVKLLSFFLSPFLLNCGDLALVPCFWEGLHGTTPSILRGNHWPDQEPTASRRCQPHHRTSLSPPPSDSSVCPTQGQWEESESAKLASLWEAGTGSQAQSGPFTSVRNSCLPFAPGNVQLCTHQEMRQKHLWPDKQGPVTQSN